MDGFNAVYVTKLHDGDFFFAFILKMVTDEDSEGGLFDELVTVRREKRLD